MHAKAANDHTETGTQALSLLSPTLEDRYTHTALDYMSCLGPLVGYFLVFRRHHMTILKSAIVLILEK